MKKDFDLYNLNLDELIELNKLVVDRIKYLRDLKAIKEKVLFKKGDFVSFQKNNEFITGRVTKINIKTISLKTENGQEWRVSPHLLNKILKIY